MNIGYIYGFHPYPPQGGNGVHVYQLVQWFVKRGHTVSTLGDPGIPNVTSYPSDHGGTDKFLRAIDILYIRIDGTTLDRVPVKRTCLDRASVPIVWEINAPSEKLAFWKSEKSKENGYSLPTIAHRLRWNVFKMKVLYYSYQEEKIRRWYATKVNAAICVTNELERYARQELGIKQIYVLSNGSDPELFTPQREAISLDSRYASYFKVVYAGSPRYPWQGMDILQKVVERMSRITKNILFMYLVNQGSPYIPRTDNVLLFEKVNYFDVARYILAADACLCFCGDFSWSKWGCYVSPVKLFDYMACAKPVIASRVGQIPTIIDHCQDGLLTDNRVEDVVEKIIFLFEHREKAREMGGLAREKVIRYYNWERVADQTLDILTSLHHKSSSC